MESMRDFLNKCGGYAVIDGGFATELERLGVDLNDPLWSAKCLFTSPHLVRRVHLDYLDAGANIILTSSYQATIQGFEAKGFSKEEGKALLQRSVELAREARDIYYDRGDYGDAVTVQTLKDFHRERVKILVDAGADLIAFETIPNKLDAQAYAELMEEEGIEIPAWFSFSCKDENNVASGESILECASIADSCKQVVAVGVNCTAPRFIHGLISSIKKKSSGEAEEDFVPYIGKWRYAGASLFGGCCRTTPKTIRGIAEAIYEKSHGKSI
ncbi:hypothetical protein TSUD_45990 [Trifolium subterraneum]|nr:hypothetical protein TSUD_45990 [Trifolium subterraneum]